MLSRNMARRARQDQKSRRGNGAQKLSANVVVQDVKGQDFAPQRGKVNGFLADSYIVQTETTNAHNNITNPACGKLVAAVLQS